MVSKSIKITGKRNQESIFRDKKTNKRVADIIPKIGNQYNSYYKQIQAINMLYLDNDCSIEHAIIKKELIKKLNGYKQQDIKKDILNLDELIDINSAIQLLVESKLKCCYCNNKMSLVYSDIREPTQWTLDRIDNDIGHNINNVVISCLQCNLQRRRTNKEAFEFTKKLQIKKIG